MRALLWQEAKEAFKVFKQDTAAWEVERAELRATVQSVKKDASDAQAELRQQLEIAEAKKRDAERKLNAFLTV